MSKKILYLLVPAIFFLAACGGASTTAKVDEADAAKMKQADSLTTEMDNIQSEIETKKAELEKALQDIDN
jgi:uncharacterized lipoprotein YajG